VDAVLHQASRTGCAKASIARF